MRKENVFTTYIRRGVENKAVFHPKHDLVRVIRVLEPPIGNKSALGIGQLLLRKQSFSAHPKLAASLLYAHDRLRPTGKV